ncbi:class I SAM-dependent RNA methyltransferase [Phycicoccus ginsengisoli]
MSGGSEPTVRANPGDLSVGDEVEVEVGPVAHGGFCVARHEGRVVFVRHALPGERVVARVTEAREGQRFVRADAVAVTTASPHRVQPPCPYAGPGLCGGCDFQHVDPAYQRELKTAVVREQLSRLAGLDVEVVVEELPGAPDGLGWRTRVEFAVDESGRAGLRKHRSHDVVPVDTCLIADPRVLATGVLQRDWPGETSVDVVAPSEGEAVVVPVPGADAVPVVTEAVRGEHFSGEFEVSARGFWQVHPAAAPTFVDTVLRLLAPQPGETALDLYAGVGLFARALAEQVGPTGRVVAVESDPRATDEAERNLAGLPSTLVVRGRVDDVFGVPRPSRKGAGGNRRATRGRKLRRHPMLPPTADLVVLDPPRTGAGRDVVAQVAALRARGVAYVACDPAALARDTAYLAEHGYALQSLRAFDAFPMTHHLECIVLFERTGP